jgi:uncharacterized protein YndB with AHSA1/START domain
MPNIHHALLIAAPVEKVYTAITTGEGLSAWWTPNTTVKAVVNSIARFPFGNGYFKEMKITALKPFELVKWNCIKGADEWIGTNIFFKLIPGDKESLLNLHPEILGQIEQQGNDKGTLLIFHHDDWKEYTPMFAECNYTWGQFLRGLKLLCETGKGSPWPNQHRIER